MEDWITDINVKTVNYIKKCKKIKCARHLKMTKKYLKDNNLLAVPFDKGVGICLMSKDSYNKKMDKLIKLPQFQKLEKGRSNAKNPILKEEERVINTLKDLKKKGKIDEKLFIQHSIAVWETIGLMAFAHLMNAFCFFVVLFFLFPHVYCIHFRLLVI